MAPDDPSPRPQFLPTSDIEVQVASSKGNTSSTGSLAEETENPFAPIETFVKPTVATLQLELLTSFSNYKVLTLFPSTQVGKLIAIVIIRKKYLSG